MPLFTVPEATGEDGCQELGISGERLRSRENIVVKVLNNSEDVSLSVAREISDLIKQKNAEGTACVLGLATGSTPLRLYAELVRMHKEEGLSFANVTTFNLDEYFPMDPTELQSYHRFMHENLFDLVDIDKDRVHIPNGRSPSEDIRNTAPFMSAIVRTVEQRSDEYEAAIEAAGGIDLQLLGVGRRGHIGFNESGSDEASVTRLVDLDPITRIDASSDFFGEENVPRMAITMGVGTIMKARRIVLMAFGENKSTIVARAVEGPVTKDVPMSFLQKHPNACLYLDASAAGGLTRAKCPWQLGRVQWSDDLLIQAVVWLSRQASKAILRLTSKDYEQHGLQDLLWAVGRSAEQINKSVSESLQATITEDPAEPATGCRPPANPRTSQHSNCSGVTPQSSGRRAEGTENGCLPVVMNTNGSLGKRVLIFSPHPDDDVISMGATFYRMCRLGHDVHVAYQTSGSIAVRDSDVLRYTDMMAQSMAVLSFSAPACREAKELHESVFDSLHVKRPGQLDCNEVLHLKAQIRYAEAVSAATYCGALASNLHFLNMPFYETGKIVKKPLGPADIRIVVNLLNDIRPDIIFAAGDLSDPHGTHFTCLQAIIRALEEVRESDWWRDQPVWLYRGAWQEWDAHEIDMAVPFSPKEVKHKREAIWRHESQKDRPMFPGPDPREFWQRAEDRNRATAVMYKQLGLPEYEAMEAFVRYDPQAPAAIFKARGLACEETPA
eukprot:jgi/Botrbrau1/8148/Bobra.0308s0036.1